MVYWKKKMQLTPLQHCLMEDGGHSLTGDSIVILLQDICEVSLKSWKENLTCPLAV